jgi:hypothetical protein
MNPSAGDGHWVRNSDNKRVRILTVVDDYVVAKQPRCDPYIIHVAQFVTSHHCHDH